MKVLKAGRTTRRLKVTEARTSIAYNLRGNEGKHDSLRGIKEKRENERKNMREKREESGEKEGLLGQRREKKRKEEGKRRGIMEKRGRKGEQEENKRGMRGI